MKGYETRQLEQQKRRIVQPNPYYQKKLELMALQQITLRTEETQKQYMDYLKNTYKGNCIFCDKELLEKEFEHWIIIKNKFPYDRVFCNHRLLATKRHVIEDINDEERKELKKILAEEEYNHCILNKKRYRSIPQHFHYHLVNVL